MANTGTDTASVTALRAAGPWGSPKDELGGGGVDGAEEDEVGAGFGGGSRFLYRMGGDADLPVRAEEFPCRPPREWQFAARCTPAASEASATSTRSLTKSPAPYRSHNRFTFPRELQQFPSAQVLLPELNGPDAAFQGLLQHPRELAAPLWSCGR